MNSGQPTSDFLVRVRRQARGTLLAWAAATDLLALALIEATRLGWIAWGEEAAWVAMAATLFLLGWWFKRVRRLTPAVLARDLDARWALQSRLEAAMEMAGHPSAWAEAQRNDASQKIADREPPGALPWTAGLIFLVAALCMVGFEGGVVAWRTWRPHPAGAVAAAPPGATPAAKDPAKPPAAVPQKRASIVWKSPDTEIRATAIEEVPLTAYAESEQGFRAVSLVYSINGGSEVSVPLDATALGDSAKGGGHELTPSLYMDELKVKPFDLVQYHLAGELNVPAPGGPVASPPQFIQIRRPQVDMGLGGGGDGKLIGMLYALKTAQLQLIKENFVLIHTPGGKSDADWRPENQRVATEQTRLAGTADETRKAAAAENVPAEMLGDLEQAGAAMNDAGKEIGAEANETAATRQNRALALIIACEKFFGQAAGGQPPPASDPFADGQKFTLPPRASTPAGQLEQLAQRQQQNNGSPGGGDTGQEGAIAQDAQKLSAAGHVDPSAQKSLQAAAAAAADAARQMGQNDRSAARVPAAAAQQAFEDAVAAQESAGRAGAAAELDRIRRLLNAAGRIDDTTARKEKLTTAAISLRAAAVQQQQTGSADAAAQLAALAALIDGAKAPGKGGEADASAPYSTARAREAAKEAAHTSVMLTSPAVALNRAIRQLNQSGKQILAGPGATSGVPVSDHLADLEIASQEAEWLTDDSATIGLAGQVAGQAGALQQANGSDGAALRNVADSAAKLAAALERARGTGPRDEIVRRFKPDDIEPAYRAAVESYFEHLSRDAAAVRKANPQ